MKKYISSIRRYINFSLSSFIVFSVSTFSAYSQQMPKMNTDSAKIKNVNDKSSQMSDDEEIAHPFFTHMACLKPWALIVYGLLH
jgi:hypothetical protein